MVIEATKKKYPILDENGQPCTFPTFASQVFMDDGSTTVSQELQDLRVQIESLPKPQLIVTAPAGSTITAVNGEDVVTGVVGAEGTLTLDLPAFGTWTVTAALDGQEASTSVNIEQEYPVALSYITNFTVNGGHGETVTVYHEGESIGSVTLDSTGTGTLELNGVGGKTLVFTGGLSGYERTVNVGIEKEMTVNVYPDNALFWHGRQFAEISGGWGYSVVGSTSYYKEYNSGASVGNQLKVSVQGSGAYQCNIASKKSINLAGYSNVNFMVETQKSGDYVYRNVAVLSGTFGNLEKAATTGVSQNGIHSIPIDSALENQYYIGVVLQMETKGSGSIAVSEVYLT